MLKLHRQLLLIIIIGGTLSFLNILLSGLKTFNLNGDTVWTIIWGYTETPAAERKQSDTQTSVSTRRAKAIVTTTTSNPTTTKSTAQLIEEYHLEAKRRCLADYENDTHVQGYYCPCLPTTFRGRKIVNSNEQQWNWTDIFLVAGANWTFGGEWKPADCVARYHMAVIIPFRDRDFNLKALLHHLIPLLQKQFIHFRIFVVEQNLPAVFNKATMMNIGFLEVSKLFPEMNCVMFQDADSLLEDDRLLMRCDDRVHHYALRIKRYRYRWKYFGQFGGVVTIRPEMFRTIDGFPIDYFGWGGEDDDMRKRVMAAFGTIFRPPNDLCIYTTLDHIQEGSNPKNEKRSSLMWRSFAQYHKRQFRGMSLMSYTIENIQRRSFYTYIHANLNASGLLYPTHNQSLYTKLNGVCPDEFYYDKLLKLSSVTCRYLCDVAQPPTPCYGYTYYTITAEDALLGTTTSTCRLLSKHCTSVIREHEAFTYISEETDTPAGLI